MLDLTFGEQVKIILSRRGMTIKQLAELVEEHTGKPMSRQNMTQRLGRDNFQEQDMRLIAEILGCDFQLNLLDPEVVEMEAETAEDGILTRDITIGDLLPEEPEHEEDETALAEEQVPEEVSVEPEKQPEVVQEEKNLLRKGVRGYFRRPNADKVEAKPAELPKKDGKKESVGEINPYTRQEYKTNSVRTHPKRIGYVQVYDRAEHKWTDMTEWAFLAYQERKKLLMGKNYEPPTYLD